MTSSFDEKLDAALKREDWISARRLLQTALKREPHDHWLLTRLATTYYEDRDYDTALRFSEKAFSEQPDCPLVLWDYASALDMTGQTEAAIEVWKQLVDAGAESIAANECSEGLRWAKSLVNDSRYRIALAYGDLGQNRLAVRYLRDHLWHRTSGLPSLYQRREVKERLERLVETVAAAS